MSLKGLTIVLTGDFQKRTRAEATTALEKLGAKVSGSVSSKTSVVFAGRAAGSKLDKARGLGLPVLDEAALESTLANKALPAGVALPAAGAAKKGAQPAAATAAPAPAPSAPAPAVPARVFLDPITLRADASPADALAVVRAARWDAFDAARDLLPLREWLAALEARHGVTEAHRACTERLRVAGAILVQPCVHEAQLVATGLSPDGRYFATGSWVGDDYERGGTVAVWEVASGRCVNVLDPIHGGVGWPDYGQQIQWAHDGSVLGVGFNTNAVGAWNPFAAKPEPIAEAYVTDGWDRPPAWGWAPDARRVYITCYRQGHEVPGAIAVLEPPDARQRYNRWGRREVSTTFMAKKMAQRAKKALGGAGSNDAFDVLDRVHWLADGTLVGGPARSNVYAIDVATGQVRFVVPSHGPAAWSPDDRLLAHFDGGRLKFADGRTGAAGAAPDCAAVTAASSLHWVMRGKVARLAALSTGAGEDPAEEDDASAATAPDPSRGVFVLDDGVLKYRIDVAPAGGDSERAAWAFAPGGELGACLTSDPNGRAEVFRLGDASYERLRSVPVPAGTTAVYLGAGGVLVAAGASSLRFVRTSDGAVLGDVAFAREAPGPRPLEHKGVDLGASLRPDPTFTIALGAGPDAPVAWGAAFPRGLVIAPDAARPALDGLLAWSVARRFAWPVRWGTLEVVAEARAGAGHPYAPREIPFAKIDPPPATPAPWPPPDDVSYDAVEAAALESVAALGKGWNSHVSELLRGAARLRAQRDEAGRIGPLLEKITEPPQRVCAAADAATILARGGAREAAQRLLASALAGLPAALNPYNTAEVCAAVASAHAALGEAREADALFARAVAAIEPENNPWQNRLAVARALIACGRDDAARALCTADAFTAREPSTFYAEPLLAWLLRTDRLELAREFLAAWRAARGAVDWSIESRVRQWLAWLGRTDLVRVWSDALGAPGARDDDSLATAVRVTGQGGPWRGLDPRGPRVAPTDAQLAALRSEHDALAQMPRARRVYPTKQLAERAAQAGHFGAALDLLARLPANDLNHRAQSAFHVLWLAGTGLMIAP